MLNISVILNICVETVEDWQIAQKNLCKPIALESYLDNKNNSEKTIKKLKKKLQKLKKKLEEKIVE